MDFLNRTFIQDKVNTNVQRYSDGKGQQFYVFSDGYPVNFRDYSILGNILDAVYSELFLCVREIFEGRVPIGLSDSWAELHKEVAETWCNCYLDGLEYGQKHGSKRNVFCSPVSGPVNTRVPLKSAHERLCLVNDYPARRKNKLADTPVSTCEVTKEVEHA